MPPKPCESCHTARALIIRPKTRQKLCRPCFLLAFETEIHHTITSHALFHRGERIAIGASGGKDSTVLAAVLATLNTRHDYGLQLQLLSIDEGIAGYRDDSLAAVRRNAADSGIPLTVVGYRELYGWTMDQVVKQNQSRSVAEGKGGGGGRGGNCTYCGVFRRQALDRGAALLGIRHVVTGHNADDIAETVVMNLLRGDLPRLSRATNIVTSMAGVAGQPALSEIKRSKPLKYAYEKEIVLYAHHRSLDYFSTECVYAPEAFRGSARTLVKNLERVRPEAILDLVRSGEDVARLVPGRDAAAVVSEVEGEGEGEGGCGSLGGGGGGGLAGMRALEGRLAMGERDDVLAQRHVRNEKDVELTAGTGAAGLLASTGAKTAAVPVKNRPRQRHVRKKPAQQTMGSCSRCGYISSQLVCKACMLLEGLNRDRPRVEIELECDSGAGGDVSGGGGDISMGVRALSLRFREGDGVEL
ncbi:MAG: nucleotidyltransferase [Trizodia sp. TS-e1964]|nr:MAG: nucleotidyltransferase [Trizodia sp. TS-e1964]